MDAKSSQLAGDVQAQGQKDDSVKEIAGQLAGQVIQGALTQWDSSDDSSKIMNQFKTASGGLICCHVQLTSITRQNAPWQTTSQVNI